MLALYRSGQQADALAAYQFVRAHLADELGVDPGRELRDLHTRMLNADPGLTLPAEQATSAPRQLPLATSYFVGRDDELRVLTELAGLTERGEPW